jgi:type IV pilus assembly protein PilV
VTLIEAMISMTLLLIGLLALARLQVLGLTSTAGGRLNTFAWQGARELAAGIEQLPLDDALLSPSGGAGSEPPARFGSMLGVTDLTGVHLSGSGLPPGVRADSELARNTARRWTVWDYAPAGGTAAAKFIAISVVYQERWIERDREALLYTHRSDPGAAIANIAAFR